MSRRGSSAVVKDSLTTQMRPGHEGTVKQSLIVQVEVGRAATTEESSVVPIPEELQKQWRPCHGVVADEAGLNTLVTQLKRRPKT
jgi:hypothetical protein